MRHWTLLLREILSIALSLVSLCETHGEEIDKVVVGGPFEPTVASLSQYECPEWFRDAKFWHLRALGRLLGGRTGRVVCPRDVPGSIAGLSASRRHMGASVEVRLPRFHPAVEGGEVRSGRLAHAVQGGGGEVA